MSLIIDGTNGVTYNDSSLQGAAASPYVLKNRIINGAMQIWQRGTSVAVSSGGGAASSYWADRFCTNYQNYTASRSTDAPTGFQYSADINPGATVNYTTTIQKIESLNCADLVGQTVTVSCYAKSITGASAGLSISLDYANSVDNFSAYTGIAAATVATTLSSSWTRYSATFTNLPAGAANGLQVGFYTNNTVAANYRITGVQLEVGSTATPFERRLYNQELANCQRYYEIQSATYTTSAIPTMVAFKVTKRAVPTISVTTTSGATATVSGGAYTGTDAFRVSASSASDFTWTSSIEL
jgi:hypothetical protein